MKTAVKPTGISFDKTVFSLLNNIIKDVEFFAHDKKMSFVIDYKEDLYQIFKEAGLDIDEIKDIMNSMAECFVDVNSQINAGYKCPDEITLISNIKTNIKQLVDITIEKMKNDDTIQSRKFAISILKILFRIFDYMLKHILVDDFIDSIPLSRLENNKTVTREEAMFEVYKSIDIARIFTAMQRLASMAFIPNLNRYNQDYLRLETRAQVDTFILDIKSLINTYENNLPPAIKYLRNEETMNDLVKSITEINFQHPISDIWKEITQLKKEILKDILDYDENKNIIQYGKCMYFVKSGNKRYNNDNANDTEETTADSDNKLSSKPRAYLFTSKYYGYAKIDYNKTGPYPSHVNTLIQDNVYIIEPVFEKDILINSLITTDLDLVYFNDTSYIENEYLRDYLKHLSVVFPIIPAFFYSGRLSIDKDHYQAYDKDKLIPAALIYPEKNCLGLYVNCRHCEVILYNASRETRYKNSLGYYELFDFFNAIDDFKNIYFADIHTPRRAFTHTSTGSHLYDVIVKNIKSINYKEVFNIIPYTLDYLFVMRHEDLSDTLSDDELISDATSKTRLYDFPEYFVNTMSVLFSLYTKDYIYKDFINRASSDIKSNKWFDVAKDIMSLHRELIDTLTIKLSARFIVSIFNELLRRYVYTYTGFRNVDESIFIRFYEDFDYRIKSKMHAFHDFLSGFLTMGLLNILKAYIKNMAEIEMNQGFNVFDSPTARAVLKYSIPAFVSKIMNKNVIFDDIIILISQLLSDTFELYAKEMINNDSTWILIKDENFDPFNINNIKSVLKRVITGIFKTEGIKTPFISIPAIVSYKTVIKSKYSISKDYAAEAIAEAKRKMRAFVFSNYINLRRIGQSGQFEYKKMQLKALCARLTMVDNPRNVFVYLKLYQDSKHENVAYSALEYSVSDSDSVVTTFRNPEDLISKSEFFTPFDNDVVNGGVGMTMPYVKITDENLYNIPMILFPTVNNLKYGLFSANILKSFYGYFKVLLSLKSSYLSRKTIQRRMRAAYEKMRTIQLRKFYNAFNTFDEKESINRDLITKTIMFITPYLNMRKAYKLEINNPMFNIHRYDSLTYPLHLTINSG